MNFAQRLLKLMQQNQITKFKLSKMLNVSPSSVANWLVGASSPSIDKIRQIATIFQVTTDYLLNGEDAGNTQDASLAQLEQLLLNTFRSASANNKIAMLQYAEQLTKNDSAYQSPAFAEVGKADTPQLTAEDIKRLKLLLNKYDKKEL